MSTMTYTTLTTDLKALTNRATPKDPILKDMLPRIIERSQREIVADLKLQGYETTLKTKLPKNESILAKPERYRQTISMHIKLGASRQPLFARSYEYLRAYWPDADLTDRPMFYADHGDAHWVFGPTPAFDYELEIKVYLLPLILSEKNQTNWLTHEAPELLFARCLRNLSEAAEEWKDVDRYQALYTERLGALGAQDMAKIMDRTAQREKP